MLKEGTLHSHVIQPSKTHRIFGQYIIKHGFQFKCALVLSGVMAVFLGIVWLECHWIVGRLIDTNAVQGDVKEQLELLVGITGKTGFLAAVVIFALTLFLSHFVAGPIFRFEKTFEQMRDGNLGGHVRLRGHDEFKESADLLNQALSSIRNKLKKEREANDVLWIKANSLVKEWRDLGFSEQANQLDKLFRKSKDHLPQINI
ncbi:MAG: hypothetical protein KCHDKBKB_02194 [Elusimicrobia bacterium]|nr:hypothetical protein [Elusimicrobiota bacterium]